VDIAAAIAHYDALLAGDGALADGSAAMLLERQPQEHLLFGERLMCYALRPQLLDAARFAEIDRVCGALAGAIKRLEPVLLGDERLLDLLDLDPRERRLVAVDPGYPDAAPVIPMPPRSLDWTPSSPRTASASWSTTPSPPPASPTTIRSARYSASCR